MWYGYILLTLLNILFDNFSMKGGVNVNAVWPPSVGNSWRTTGDIRDYWGSMLMNIDAVSRCWEESYNRIKLYEQNVVISRGRIYS
jgi:hypothetical protein